MSEDPKPRPARPELDQADDVDHGTPLSEQRTVDLTGLDPNATIDPNETVAIAAEAAFDPYRTDDARSELARPPAAPAPSSTDQSTIVPEPAESSGAGTESPRKPTASLDQTAGAEEIGNTLELADIGKGSLVEIARRFAGGLRSAGHSSSVLADTDIAQTINPRELSAEEAALWGNLTGSSAAEPSQLAPAINRSLSETKLLLRAKVIADARSEMAKQADYRLIRLLGKGGMGNVYAARQGSLDRNVALKVIKPLEETKRAHFKRKGILEQVEQDRRLQFISEAVVTGDLDHPNIVPIHDIAVTSDKTLFYSMKRVSGTPWSKVIHEKSSVENLDILLKVCDAIGFAHTRGVVHRDIKPENIMLGEFGVVMVMDWGLALAKPEFDKLESVHHSTGLGGSPAYMAPEMATGPVERIGPASDVYLLGATLFQIVTSFAPHQASTISECLKVVATNKIRDVPPDRQGELLQIALKAMATKPEDRFASVQAFQDAIRDYRSHSESIRLASDAEVDLGLATKSSSYEGYSRAIFGYEEALKLWEGNGKAKQGLAVAKLRYAEAAQQTGDYDLGLSLLDPADANHQPLLEQLKSGKRDRIKRAKKHALLRKVAAAMTGIIIIAVGIIIIGGGWAIHRIRQEAMLAKAQTTIAELANLELKQAVEAEKSARGREAQQTQAALEANKVMEAERDEKEVQRQAAVEARKMEEIAKLEAEAAKKTAVDASMDALKKSLEAEEARDIAVKARASAEYEKYVSQIGLAKARIDQNQFDDARRILEKLKLSFGSDGPAWEWRWLWRQTTQSIASLSAASPGRSFAVSSNPGTIASVLENGLIQISQLERDGKLSSSGEAIRLGSGDVSTIIFSPDQQSIVIGTRGGDIEIWDRALSERRTVWTAHRATINRLQFIDDNTLVSASDDHSIRVWNTVQQSELTACWNLGPVKDFAVSQTGDQRTLVAAVAESTSGRATVWKLSRHQAGWQSALVGEFHEHQGPVLCVALSPASGMVVSGDVDGQLFSWNIADVRATDHAGDVGDAIAQLSSAASANAATQGPSKYESLVDDALSNSDGSRKRAHDDRVRVVRFSADGKTILSGGDDYSIRLWDAATAQHSKTLRGHGGWILDAHFVGGSTSLIVSTSADATMRTWQPDAYVDAAVIRRSAAEDTGPLHREEILSARLNASGDAVVTSSRDRTAIVSEINPQTMSLRRVAEFRDDVDSVMLKEGTQFAAQSFVLARESPLLYIASADSMVRVWDLNRGTEKFQIESVGLNDSLALSRDGRYLLTRDGSKDAKSLLWRVDPSGDHPPRLVFPYGGHAEELAVTALAISADGSRLFTADNAGIGILWDGRTGRQVGARFEMLRGYRINAAEFSAGGDELFIAADDQQLTRIDLSSRSIVSRLAHSGFVTSLSLADDNRSAVTISEQTTVDESRIVATLWNLSTGMSQVIDRSVSPLKRDQQSTGRRERVTAAQFGPDGRSIAVAKQTGADGAGRVVIWAVDQVGKAKPVHAFEMPAIVGTPQACIPLPDDRMLTLNGDAAFQWQLNADESKSAVHLMSYRANAAVRHANFSSDGKFVITGSHSVKIWDIETQKSVAKIELPHREPLTFAEFTPKAGSYQFATSGADGAVKLFEFDPRSFATKPLESWFDGEDLPPIRRVHFSPDGSQLLAVGDQGTIRLIFVGKPQALDYSMPDAGDLIASAFSPDGSLIVVGGEDAKARLLNLDPPGAAAAEPLRIFQGHADRIEDVKILSSAAGPLRILTASRDKSLRVWDPQLDSDDRRGREILQLRQHLQGVTAVDASASGNLVITAGRDAELVLWPAANRPAR